MDWLATSLATQGSKADIWSALSSAPNHRTAWLNSQRLKIKRILEKVLRNEPEFEQLCEYLDAALGLEGNTRERDMLLWSEPRPLLLQVIPALLRQLETNWQRVEQGVVTPWSDA